MNKEQKLTRIALTDDHVVLRSGLSKLVNDFEGCEVVIEAAHGEELLAAISGGIVPDLVLLDLNMPVLDGYETARRLQQSHPAIHILILSVYDTELMMIRLLQAGAKGFLKKDAEPAELKLAIQTVMESGYYYTNTTTGKLVNLFRKSQENSLLLRTTLSELEMRFLRLSCTEMTYKEIAGVMHINPRAVDNLRDNLFEKLEVRSRVGLAMFSIRHGIETF